MACDIGSLPVEILFSVLESISCPDERQLACLRLGATSSHFRSSLLPKAYHTVRFSNDSRASDSALLAARAHGRYIQALHFTILDPHDSSSLVTDQERAFRNHTIPHSALTLFSAPSSLLPNLQTFTIRHEHDFSDWPKPHYNRHAGLDFFNSREVALEQTHRGEARSSLRALWRNTYAALTNTSNRPIPNLVIESWPPKRVSTFLTPAWKTYLSRLDSFTISLGSYLGFSHPTPGGHLFTVLTCNVSRYPGYAFDVSRMSDYFLNNVDSARTIKVQTTLPGLTTGWWRVPLGHEPRLEAMPSLRNLELGNLSVTFGLVKFLLSKRDTITILVLKGAMAVAFAREFPARIIGSGGDGVGTCNTADTHIYEHVFSWADFFDALSGEDGLTLSRFEVTSTCPLTRQEARSTIESHIEEFPIVQDFARGGGCEHGKDANHDARRAMEIRQYIASPENKHRDWKLFGYADVNNHTSIPYFLPGANRERFWVGNDQAAYERFMVKVNANKGGER